MSVIDHLIAGDTRSWSRHHYDADVLEWMLSADICSARRMFRDGYLSAADLGEYTSALVGLHAARALELQDNDRWKLEAYR